jgi:chemotaxis protein methyltransferase WspC
MNARELLQRETGLDLPPATVERALRERMLKCGATDAGQYLRAMAPTELAALIELVVVPESWMFRDPNAFVAATAFAQRRLAERPGRVVRILSLPCAGGEEPYSMAMALTDAGVAPSSFRIEGIDLSAASIERATAGRYTRNAFRGRALGFRERYFSRHGDQYQISDALRAQVAFAQGNLLAFDATTAAGRYDLVFCRNLLIYFDEPTSAAAVALLRTLLADDGMLLAGYAEVPAFCRNGFAPLRLPGAFALRKACAPAPAVPAPAAPAPPRARPAPPRMLGASPPPEPRPDKAVEAAPPADPEPMLAQARRQADQGDYRAAAAACQAVLAADPQSADACFILGIVSECQNQPGVAGDYWRRCVYLKPDHYEALCHLALLAERTGDAPQAAALRQRAARVYRRQHEGSAA